MDSPKNGAAPSVASTEPIVRLVIEMRPGGNIQINGPIDNMLLCYGLLEIAKDSIRRHNAQSNGSRIQVPQFGASPGL